ncbi:hypothetical protein DID88_003073 [Monilinia fructigena]|uniref:Effector 5 n=1 Tax=Monilinia fructigena TaxID=38457 RepID=A0A395IET6_9HELO|nr:hypothetical protein DID88_003073 [Monilinia fructigena]
MLLSSSSIIARGELALLALAAPSISRPAWEKNAKASNGGVWIGNQGPNTFAFTNSAAAPVTVIIWTQAAGDYQSSFMNARKPQVFTLLIRRSNRYNIHGKWSVSGGWAGLYNGKTTLSQYGQIYNTWGEFTTGAYATVDVSREVNMGGNAMSIQVDGCTSNMSKCVFKCKKGNTCGEAGTYFLSNCAAGSQKGATFGLAYGQPSGGCQGFNNGGKVSVTFSD